MGLEAIESPNIVYINSLVVSNPVGGTDEVKSLDNHIRGVKNVLLLSLPNVDGPCTPTPTEFNKLTGMTRSTADLNDLATKNGTETLIAKTLSDNLFEAYREKVTAKGSVGGAQSFDVEVSNVHTITLTSNMTVTLTSPSTSGDLYTLTIVLTQDATGGRTVAWPGTINWPAGSIPPLLTSANSKSTYAFTTLDAGSSWDGYQIGYDQK